MRFGRAWAALSHTLPHSVQGGWSQPVANCLHRASPPRRYTVRRAAFAMVLGVMGCATAGGAGSKGAPARPSVSTNAEGKPEVVVIGRGPEKIGVSPEEQGTEFIVRGRNTYRCTKPDRPQARRGGQSGDDLTNCRLVNTGEGRNPDPGRVERSSTQ